jgi:hypothetical protein
MLQQCSLCNTQLTLHILSYNITITFTQDSLSESQHKYLLITYMYTKHKI